jgi:hypothetical protein
MGLYIYVLYVDMLIIKQDKKLVTEYKQISDEIKKRTEPMSEERLAVSLALNKIDTNINNISFNDIEYETDEFLIINNKNNNFRFDDSLLSSASSNVMSISKLKHICKDIFNTASHNVSDSLDEDKKLLFLDKTKRNA